MRHRKGFNHLGRTSAHRKAMLSNMASSLILHKRITTTTAKAKALRTYIEPLITRSKDDTTHSRRVVFSYLKNKYAVSELFREVSPKIMDRPGGYTRILKTGNRLGDNAEMCIIELVDYNENMLEDITKKTKSTRRRRGSGKAKAEAKDDVQAEVKEAIADDMESTADVEEVAPDTGEDTPDVKEASHDTEDLQSEAQTETKPEASTSASAETKADKDSEVKAEVKEEEAEVVKEEKKEKTDRQSEAEVKAEGKKEEEEKTEEDKSDDTDKEGDKKE